MAKEILILNLYLFLILMSFFDLLCLLKINKVEVVKCD